MTEQINVLHVYKTALSESIGGVEMFIDSLCRSTTKLNIRNTVLSLSRNPSQEKVHSNSYESVVAKQDIYLASTGFSFSAFGLFHQLLTVNDIIHYHFPNPFADLLHFSTRRRKPSIVTYHSDIVKQRTLMHLYRPIMNRFLESADSIVATSPNYVQHSSVLQNYKHKIKVIPVGVNQSDFRKPSNELSGHWKCKLPDDFFLFVGALRYYKGLHVALEAVQNTDIPLVIAGSGGVENDLIEMASHRRLENVYFLGQITEEDKITLLHLCRGFVFPSHLRSEAFGLSLVEAAICGKPMISCEIHTGTSFINQHQQTGLVITPNSPDELRKAMQHLLDHPKDVKRFGANAKRRAQTVFNSETTAKMYAKLYFEIHDKGSSDI